MPSNRKPNGFLASFQRIDALRANPHGPFTLERIAKDAIYFLSDDVDEAEMDKIKAMSPEHIVRLFYTSSDCDVFAVALHRITGWPIVELDDTLRGHIHRLNLAPGGRLVDASGWTDIKTLSKRYALLHPHLGEPGGRISPWP